MRPVKTKSDFVRRYMNGEFGNRSPTWGTLNDFMNDAREGRLYHVRSKIKGGPTYYNLQPDQVAFWWKKTGGCVNSYISEMAPTGLTTFQGEVQQGPRGLELTYSCVAKTMREALAYDMNCTVGLLSTLLCEHFMDPTSFDWVNELFRLYPDHVVEFSCYSQPFGTIPGLNTVIWEVRKY